MRMRDLVVILAFLALIVGAIALGGPSDAAFPNPGTGKGNGKHHGSCKPPNCDPCWQLVDATPEDTRDCSFVCEPIPGCVP